MTKLVNVVTIDDPSVGVGRKEVRYLLPEDVRRRVLEMRLVGDSIER
jgi:hypothetical protein